MFLKLFGFRKLDFVPDGGEAVKGNQLFVGWEEDGVTGMMTDKLFIRDGLELPTLAPGMMLDVQFNRRGKVIAVKAATAPAAKS